MTMMEDIANLRDQVYISRSSRLGNGVIPLMGMVLV